MTPSVQTYIADRFYEDAVSYKITKLIGSKEVELGGRDMLPRAVWNYINLHRLEGTADDVRQFT